MPYSTEQDQLAAALAEIRAKEDAEAEAAMARRFAPPPIHPPIEYPVNVAKATPPELAAGPTPGSSRYVALDLQMVADSGRMAAATLSTRADLLSREGRFSKLPRHSILQYEMDRTMHAVMTSGAAPAYLNDLIAAAIALRASAPV